MNADNDFHTVTTFSDADHDLWHLGEDGRWRGTGADPSEDPGLSFEELTTQWGPLTPR